MKSLTLLAALVAFTLPLHAQSPVPNVGDMAADNAETAQLFESANLPLAAAYFDGRVRAFDSVLDGSALTDGVSYRDLAGTYHSLYVMAYVLHSPVAALTFLGLSDAYDLIADLVGEPPAP